MSAPYVRFGKARIHYDVRKSPSRKTIEIVVVGKKSVSVLAPENKSEGDIRKIVKSNSRWIFQKQLDIEDKHHEKLTYLGGSKLLYLGKKYTLIVLRIDKLGIEKNSRIFTFQNGKFIVRVSDVQPNKIKVLYEKWLENHARKLLEKKVRDYCEVLDLEPNTLRIKIKAQRNRVGSLGRNLILNFNKNILRLPLNVIEYVVVHELCHVRIPSHSTKYWQLVTTVMSDYKKRKEWLERNSQLIVS